MNAVQVCTCAHFSFCHHLCTMPHPPPPCPPFSLLPSFGLFYNIRSLLLYSCFAQSIDSTCNLYILICLLDFATAPCFTVLLLPSTAHCIIIQMPPSFFLLLILSPLSLPISPISLSISLSPRLISLSLPLLLSPSLSRSLSQSLSLSVSQSLQSLSLDTKRWKKKRRNKTKEKLNEQDRDEVFSAAIFETVHPLLDLEDSNHENACC